MKLVSPKDSNIYRLVKTPILKMVMRSILQGYTLGEVFLCESGLSAFIWDKTNNSFYFCGKLDIEFADEVRAIIHTSKSICMIEGKKYFRAISHPQYNPSFMESVFKGINLNTGKRLLYKVAPIGDLTYSKFYDILPIDRKLIDESGIKNFEQVVEEIFLMWGNIEKFYQCGVGYVALLHNKVIGFITTEYMSDVECGVYIEISEQYRRLGVCSSLLSLTEKTCLTKGIDLYLDTWQNNQSTIFIAQKYNFDEISSYEVYYGELDDLEL